MIDTDRLRRLLALNGNDREAVENKVREELRELLRALSYEAESPREQRFNVVSEMADVLITLNELEMVMGCRDELRAMVDYKVARTLYEGADGREKS